MKTSELSGVALDWAVTKAEGFDASIEPGETWGCWGWATDWAQGGPIIEREGITLARRGNHSFSPWGAVLRAFEFDQDGPTPLVAAMRCYVASMLGAEVEIPEELK